MEGWGGRTGRACFCFPPWVTCVDHRHQHRNKAVHSTCSCSRQRVATLLARFAPRVITLIPHRPRPLLMSLAAPPLLERGIVERCNVKPHHHVAVCTLACDRCGTGGAVSDQRHSRWAEVPGWTSLHPRELRTDRQSVVHNQHAFRTGEHHPARHVGVVSKPARVLHRTIRVPAGGST